jgi:hypothetical protein
VARRWRLNAPPNWPIPAGADLDLNFRPDPAWGPPPVGWPLWHRERTISLIAALYSRLIQNSGLIQTNHVTSCQPLYLPDSIDGQAQTAARRGGPKTIP